MEGAYKDLAERFIGAQADNIQDIWQTAYRGRFYRGGPVLMVCSTFHHKLIVLIDHLECALWTRYCSVGHQREKAWSTGLAAFRRESA